MHNIVALELFKKNSIIFSLYLHLSLPLTAPNGIVQSPELGSLWGVCTNRNILPRKTSEKPNYRDI